MADSSRDKDKDKTDKDKPKPAAKETKQPKETKSAERPDKPKEQKEAPTKEVKKTEKDLPKGETHADSAKVDAHAKEAKEAKPGPTKVYVSRLTRNVKAEHLSEIFGTFGRVRSVDVPTNSFHTEFSKGYAYIEMEAASSAAEAVSHMDGGQIDGQVIRCELVAKPRDKDNRHVDDKGRHREREPEKERVRAKEHRDRDFSRKQPRFFP